MLSDERLQEMADDIKEHGLIHPIVLDKDGVLLDGRNRLAACKIAGVEPRFDTYTGNDDPVIHILGLNVHRRHVPQSALAMAIAIVYPRSHSPRVASANASVSFKQMVTNARTIIKEFGDPSPEVDYVLNGGSVREILEQIRARKAYRESLKARLAALDSDDQNFDYDLGVIKPIINFSKSKELQDLEAQVEAKNKANAEKIAKLKEAATRKAQAEADAKARQAIEEKIQKLLEQLADDDDDDDCAPAVLDTDYPSVSLEQEVKDLITAAKGNRPMPSIAEMEAAYSQLARLHQMSSDLQNQAREPILFNKHDPLDANNHLRGLLSALKHIMLHAQGIFNKVREEQKRIVSQPAIRSVK